MIKDMESYLQDLHARRTLGAGTAKDVATQHGKNRLTARERIDLLFDSGTFTEICLLYTSLLHNPRPALSVIRQLFLRRLSCRVTNDE